MNMEQLENGKTLVSVIMTTEKALESINKLVDKSNKLNALEFNDLSYNLCISEHIDGSGIKANLARYIGNRALLNVIKVELERQLDEFRNKFEEL